MSNAFEICSEPQENRAADHELVVQPSNIRPESRRVSGSAKKCSIVFIGADSPSEVNSYLHYLSADQLPADYELLFIEDCLPQIDPAYSESIKASIKIIKLAPDLEFNQLCIEAAKQAEGEYLLFALEPTSKEQVFVAVNQLESSRLSTAMDSEKNYLIIKKLPFLEAKGFADREIAQEQKRFQLMNKLENLVLGATTAAEIFQAVLIDRSLSKSSIEQYLSLVKKDDSNFYKLLFLESLKGHLDSGVRFRNIDQICDFYAKAVASFTLGQTPQIPWFLSIFQSIRHLKNDRKAIIENIPTALQQSSAILVSVYNETRFAELCFKAIRKFTSFPYHLVAINNSTIDIQDFKKAVLQEELVDEWFDSGCNTHANGLCKALDRVRKFRYITTLDSDAIVLKQNWLTEFVGRLNRANAGLIGPQSHPGSNKIKGYPVHPCCMVIDQQRIGSKFKIDFCHYWPWDAGGLITWDCLAHNIPIVKVSHEVDGDYAKGSSLINKSVRHYWYTSRIFGLDDEDELDGYKIGVIRQRLEKAYSCAELNQIRNYCVPEKNCKIASQRL